MDKLDFIKNISPEVLDEKYELFKKAPEQLSKDWVLFFKGFDFGITSFKNADINNQEFDEEYKVLNLIDAYRKRGHLFTKTNPVRTRRKYFPTLDIENFGLSINDLNKEYHSGKAIGIGKVTLKTIVNHLQDTYCRSIGSEYMFIRNPEKSTWLQHKLEPQKNTPVFTNHEKQHIFEHLVHAVGFEKYIHKKFVGQKRFSLEGAEALIPALDMLIEKGAETGIKEFIIGMSHRGRLNVLANIMQKPYEHIFQEFVGKEYEEGIALGDVKYHLGYDNEIVTDKGKSVKLSLLPNPSHLETVGAITEGLAKAHIVKKYGNDCNKACPVIVHGDAAISSQGIVYEIAQMSQLEGYKTGGTIHIVINNQVGFTTNYLDGRSSTYSTDIAKIIKAPVFHVNSDDVEAVLHTMKIAVEYRQTFHTDVFIDLLCYRKYGHNEGDEPRFTQPVLYNAISKHPNVRDIYATQLKKENILSSEEEKEKIKSFDLLLEELINNRIVDKVQIKPFLETSNTPIPFPKHEDHFKKINTGVKQSTLIKLAKKINEIPEKIQVFSKTKKIIDYRKKLIDSSKIDWALGELLCYASLVDENKPVRISGQDSIRGTFSHRHSAYIMHDTDEKYYPIKHISKTQARFDIYNSPLSEYGVLGFEYGYALGQKNGLNIWEAQFGDFYNVAQVIIDQYISSAYEKWGLINGPVLFLPHGYEGQGPEHSSARIERFLNSAINNNMQIMNLTTPANLFHALRRQVLREFKTPLIIFTPKSLLRHPKCISNIEDLENNTFAEVFDDNTVSPEKVKQVILCTGKIYYELIEKREELNINDIAIIRIEQLHPFPEEIINKIIGKYKNNQSTVWVQEEPENMGAGDYILKQFKYKIEIIARPASAAPATGLPEMHQLRKNKILEKAFRKCKCDLTYEYCGMRCAKKQNDINRKKYGYI